VPGAEVEDPWFHHKGRDDKNRDPIFRRKMGQFITKKERPLPHPDNIRRGCDLGAKGTEENPFQTVQDPEQISMFLRFELRERHEGNILMVTNISGTSDSLPLRKPPKNLFLDSGHNLGEAFPGKKILNKLGDKTPDLHPSLVDQQGALSFQWFDPPEPFRILDIVR
jgi:hypothetical protein